MSNTASQNLMDALAALADAARCRADMDVYSNARRALGEIEYAIERLCDWAREHERSTISRTHLVEIAKLWPHHANVDYGIIADHELVELVMRAVRDDRERLGKYQAFAVKQLAQSVGRS